jgi:hypothetical protein
MVSKAVAAAGEELVDVGLVADVEDESCRSGVEDRVQAMVSSTTPRLGPRWPPVKATAEGGGSAFSTWFAEDGVSLANGQAPVHGRDAIAKQAIWSPKDYQLIWTPTDGVMSSGGDMGYTWGHYEGRSYGVDGNSRVTTDVTSPSGGKSPMEAGKWCWTRATRSLRERVSAANCRPRHEREKIKDYEGFSGTVATSGKCRKQALLLLDAGPRGR